MTPGPPVDPPLLLEPPLEGGYCKRLGAVAAAATAMRWEGLVLDQNTLGVEQVSVLRATYLHHVPNSARLTHQQWPAPVTTKTRVLFPEHAIYAVAELRLKLRALPEIWQHAQPDADGFITVWIEMYKPDRAFVERVLASCPGDAPVQVLKEQRAGLTVVSHARELALGAGGTSTVLADGKVIGVLESGYPEVTLKALSHVDSLIAHVPLRARGPFTVYAVRDGALEVVFSSQRAELDGRVASGYAQWWGDDAAIAFTEDLATFELDDGEVLDKFERFWIFEWDWGAKRFVVRRPAR